MPETFAMNGGDGKYSYKNNSHYQREASNVVRGMIREEIIEKLDMKSLMSVSNTLSIADFGCSVGPNTFYAMENIMEAMKEKMKCDDDHHQLQFQVFFNDHSCNDFNTLFTSLPLDRQYFAAGVPGSFYDQLFPLSSIHFAHSSYSLQWLSEVPASLLDPHSPAWNKGRIHYTGASDDVAEAYAARFAETMARFLSARAKEIVPGGMMVLIVSGIPDEVNHSDLPAGILFDFLGSSLVDMVKEGVLNEAAVDSFNLPIYSASPREITSLVTENGCFSVEKIEMTDPRSKMNDPVNVQGLIMHLRAGMEGVFTQHFGSGIVDEMFGRTLQKSEEISLCLESGCQQGTQLLVVLKRNGIDQSASNKDGRFN